MIQTIIEDVINDHHKYSELVEPLNGENRQTKMAPCRSEKLNESRISNQTHYLHKSKKTLREKTSPILENDTFYRDKSSSLIGLSRQMPHEWIFFFKMPGQSLVGRYDAKTNKSFDQRLNFIGYGIVHAVAMLFR